MKKNSLDKHIYNYNRKFFPFAVLFMVMCCASAAWTMQSTEKQAEQERTVTRTFRTTDEDREVQVSKSKATQADSFFGSSPSEIHIRIVSFQPKAFINICLYTEMLLQDNQVCLSLMVSDRQEYEHRKGCLFLKSGLAFNTESIPTFEDVKMIINHWPHFQRICFAETWIAKEGIAALLSVQLTKIPVLNLTNCFLLTDEVKNSLSNGGFIVIDDTDQNHIYAAQLLINMAGPDAFTPPYTYIKEGKISMHHIFACAHLMAKGIAAPTGDQIDEVTRQIALGNDDPSYHQINEGLRQIALGNQSPSLDQISAGLPQIDLGNPSPNQDQIEEGLNLLRLGNFAPILDHIYQALERRDQA